MRETSRHRRLTALPLLMALFGALFLAACGSQENQFAAEGEGNFTVEVAKAHLKPAQSVAETHNLTITARNTGDETIPALTATIDLPGKESTLAFAYRNRQAGLAWSQRPVWVLEEGYPKLKGQVGQGGTETSNLRSFNFGALEPGEEADMVWRITALKPGRHRLEWQLAAGLGPDVTLEDANGEVPHGTLAARITDDAGMLRVNDRGQVVPVNDRTQRQVERSETVRRSEDG